MNKILPVSLVTFGLLTGCAADQNFDEAKARAELEVLKVEIWRQIYRDNDADALDQFLADDFVLIGPSGDTQSKQDALTDMRENPWTMPGDFLYTVDDIVFHSPTSALIYGQGNSTRTDADGNTCRHTYTSSNTVRFEDGRWRPVSSHVSGASCAPIQ